MDGSPREILQEVSAGKLRVRQKPGSGKLFGTGEVHLSEPVQRVSPRHPILGELFQGIDPRRKPRLRSPGEA